MSKNQSFRVFITGSGIVNDALQKLENDNCVIEMGTPKDSPADIAGKLKAFDPDALIVRQGQITDEVLGFAPNLKVICKHGVGTDNIDIAAATRARIPVFHTLNANFEAVASHTLALMLSLVRQIPLQDRLIRDGIYDKSSYGGLELTGKTLGLIGFGKVGRRLAELVAPFQMHVLSYHPSCTTEELPVHITKTNNVLDVLKQADIVSLHCPLTSETKYMLNKDAFHLMKSSAFLINTARGGIVNEQDLLVALDQQKISGAAFDVLEIEPPVDDHPLFQYENVILTPHIAGSSDQALMNMGLAAVGHVLAVLKQEPVDTSSMKNPEVVKR
jgi:D-3-phosphoglycerate dehydrogenase